jgi:hypothetical protein
MSVQSSVRPAEARPTVLPPPADEIPREGRYVFTGLAVASIWISVAFASIFSPDLITGSQHEHLAIAALGVWLWGACATALVLLAASRQAGAGRPVWIGLAIAVAGIWLAVALVSIFTPTTVTGTDPTTIPLGAMIAPFVGVLVTSFVAVFVAGAKSA